MDIPAQDWLRTRPPVREDRAADLSVELFGVTGEVSELGSQQDRNYRITPADGAGILLKINHPSVTRGEVDLQIAVSDRLTAAGVLTPRFLPTRTGERVAALIEGVDAECQVCAFELVAGSTLAASGPMSGVLAEELGRLAALTVKALRHLEHPAAERNIQWELGQSLSVVEKLVPDLPSDRRDLCLDAARRATSELQSIKNALPRQIIHGDLTMDNVMKDDAGQAWVIDLGDTATSWRVSELAVLIADVFGRTGSVAHAGRAVRGFCSEVQLEDSELQAIWPLVILRGAVLAVSGWSQLRIDPDNDYALERIEHEWTVFDRAAALEPEHVTSQLRLAAGRPHHPAVQYKPLLPSSGAVEIVDLGVTSELLDRGRWTEPGIERNLMWAALERATTAVARFGEARLSRVSLDISQPAATRARCVELRARPGTAVTAPFAGRVRVTGGGIELSDTGVTLRIEGLQPSVTADQQVEAGHVLGRITQEAPGLGQLLVSRRILDAPPAPLFATPDEEYEVDGAADPSPLLHLAPAPDPLLSLHAERQRRAQAMGGAAERYYVNPPQIERGWGTRLIDTQGRAYLDMVNNVSAIGHSHPRLADTVGRQLHLLNTNSRFLYRAYADFAEKLLAHSPDPALDTVIPVNSGSEAIDLAIRLAQVATGRKDVIAAREGYHGWTMAADSVSTSAFDNPAALASRPDWVHLVDAPNAYRGRYRGSNAGSQYAQQVNDLAVKLTQEGQGAAAFICEPVLGNAGGVIPPKGYLSRAYEAIRAHGGLAIADEVQVGYGRLGAAFWGSALQGAVPDIIAVAKAAGNAYPVGAVITRREIVHALRSEGMFFSSAGGAPASAIAGSAVLDVIDDEGLQENALRVGRHLQARIRKLAQHQPLIGAVHGSGLYLGVELVRNHGSLEPATAETAWICERLLSLGVIMQATSERQNVLKVKPPLTLTTEEADAFVAALDQALSEYADRG